MNQNELNASNSMMRTLDPSELALVVGGTGNNTPEEPVYPVGHVTVTGGAVTFVDWGITIPFSSLNGHGEQNSDHQDPIDDNSFIPSELIEHAKKIAQLENSSEWNKLSDKAQDSIYQDPTLLQKAIKFIENGGKINFDSSLSTPGQYDPTTNTITFRDSYIGNPSDYSISQAFFIIAHELSHADRLYNASGPVSSSLEEARATVDALLAFQAAGYDGNASVAQISLTWGKYGEAAIAARTVLQNGGSTEQAVSAAESVFSGNGA